MKTVLKDNDTVAHYWANRRQPQGRTSSHNMSFEGDSLYSYRLRIGVLVGNYGFLLRDGGSVTTNGKHLNAARGALPFNRVVQCFTALPNLSYPEPWSGWCKGEAFAITREYERLKQQFTRARLPHKKLFASQEIERLFTNTERMIECLEFEEVDRSALIDFTNIRHATPENVAFWAELSEFNTNYAQLEAEETAKREADALEAVKRWKAFDPEQPSAPYTAKTYLRVVGQDVQTSRNVTIPEHEARLAYIAFKAGRLLGQKLAGYTITQVDSTRRVVIAGCHTVDFDEIESIGQQLYAQ